MSLFGGGQFVFDGEVGHFERAGKTMSALDLSVTELIIFAFTFMLRDARIRFESEVRESLPDTIREAVGLPTGDLGPPIPRSIERYVKRASWRAVLSMNGDRPPDDHDVRTFCLRQIDAYRKREGASLPRAARAYFASDADTRVAGVRIRFVGDPSLPVTENPPITLDTIFRIAIAESGGRCTLPRTVLRAFTAAIGLELFAPLMRSLREPAGPMKRSDDVMMQVSDRWTKSVLAFLLRYLFGALGRMTQAMRSWTRLGNIAQLDRTLSEFMLEYRRQLDDRIAAVVAREIAAAERDRGLDGRAAEIDDRQKQIDAEVEERVATELDRRGCDLKRREDRLAEELAAFASRREDVELLELDVRDRAALEAEVGQLRPANQRLEDELGQARRTIEALRHQLREKVTAQAARASNGH